CPAQARLDRLRRRAGTQRGNGCERGGAARPSRRGRVGTRNRCRAQRRTRDRNLEAGGDAVTRLTRAALAALPEGVVRPGHDPATIRTGIIHFGPGAFHRAHQASYVDSLLDSDPRWGIAAVSLRSAGIADTLAAQDGLYSLTTLDRVTRIRVIAAHSAFVRPGEDAQVRRLLFDPKVRLLTSTV